MHYYAQYFKNMHYNVYFNKIYCKTIAYKIHL